MRNRNLIVCSQTKQIKKKKSSSGLIIKEHYNLWQIKANRGIYLSGFSSFSIPDTCITIPFGLVSKIFQCWIVNICRWKVRRPVWLRGYRKHPHCSWVSSWTTTIVPQTIGQIELQLIPTLRRWSEDICQSYLVPVLGRWLLVVSEVCILLQCIAAQTFSLKEVRMPSWYHTSL